MNNYFYNQLGLIDMLNIASFCLGLMNFDENLTQTDKQGLQKALLDNTEKLLNELHSHLKDQDDKIDLILKRLGDKK